MKYFISLLFLLVGVSAKAQFNKVSVEKSPEDLTIYQVDDRENSTMVYIKIIGQKDNITNIYENTYARIKGSYKQYHLLNSINMPINSNAEQHFMIYERDNQVHCFALEFEKLPKGVTFDVIENENPSPNSKPYNFYGITPDTTQIVEYVNLDKMVEDFPVNREKITYIKNDVLIQCFKQYGIALTMYLQGIEQYGKYFMVNMDLQNFSGKSILFSTDFVTATGYKVKDGLITKTIPLEVLSSEEYDKKVANKQAWNNFWAGLGEGMAAYNAGQSSSTTTYNGTSNTSVYANAYAYSGNNYGYANAYGNAYTTSYGKSHTTSYNGAAAYAAQQNAAAKLQQYANEQYQIREQLNEGYAKTNTIRNQVEYSGFFNIKYKKIDHIIIKFNIGDYEFPFVL